METTKGATFPGDWQTWEAAFARDMYAVGVESSAVCLTTQRTYSVQEPRPYESTMSPGKVGPFEAPSPGLQAVFLPCLPALHVLELADKLREFRTWRERREGSV